MKYTKKNLKGYRQIIWHDKKEIVENKAKEFDKDRFHTLIIEEMSKSGKTLKYVLYVKEYVDSLKLRMLVKNDNKYFDIKKTCPCCNSEKELCSDHQTAEIYLESIFDRSSPEWYYYFSKYIEE